MATRLHTVRRGDGPPIVFIHGMGTSAATWTACMDLLADRFTVRRAALGDVEWRWGGGAASARMTGYFRGDQTVLYVKEPRDGLAQQLQLRQGLGL